MRRLPTLGSLRAFEAAARHASFKHAAEELSVTPTAISHQIRRLETEIGRPLFRRTTRSVALTSAGELLFDPLRRAFDTIEDGLALAKQHSPRMAATLSATSAFTARLLVPKAARFQHFRSDWDLRLHASDEIVDLESGQADAAIRYGSGSYPGLASIPLLTDRFAPVCSPHLGLNSIERLQDFPLIHFDWRFASDKRSLPTWAKWIALAGVTSINPESGMSFNDEAAAIQAAIAGQGVALLSLVLVGAELRSGSLLQPFGPVLDGRQYDLVFPSRSESSPAVMLLREWLEEVFPEATA